MTERDISRSETWEVPANGESFPFLIRLFQEAKTTAEQAGLDEEAILNATFQVVSANFKMREVVRGLTAEISEIRWPSYLGVSEGLMGDCLLASLTSLVLLEQFRRGGYLEGRARPAVLAGDLGSHAWCEYESLTGRGVVLDTVWEFIGKKEEYDRILRKMAEEMFY